MRGTVSLAPTFVAFHLRPLMMRSLQTAWILTLLACASTATAQVPLDISLDHSTFRYSADETMLELYMGVGLGSLDYAPDTTGGFVATLPVEVQVRPASSASSADGSAEPVASVPRMLRFVVPDTNATTIARAYSDQVRLALPSGDYRADVVVAPSDDRPAITLSTDVSVPPYAEQEPAISSIQVASSISRADRADDPFAKSGLSIQPNPSVEFVDGMNSVPYYAELYDIDGAVGGDAYTLFVYLARSNQPNPLPDHQSRSTRPARPVDVAVGRLDISTLPTGTYFLRVAALNEANEPVAERSKKIYVIHPSVAREGVYAIGEDYETTLYEAMAGEELDLNLEHALVIADSRERSAASRLATEDDKRRFLISFWKERDTDANPSTNGARREFYSRLNVVTERFREAGQPGHTTERGRVYLQYGPPNQIDPRMFEPDLLEHVIWVYDNLPGEGRSMFVFADRYSTGRMRLLHSDVTGETSLAEWQAELQRIR